MIIIGSTILKGVCIRSIRNQLVLTLVPGVLLVTAAAGLGLYAYMDEVLERGLDAALAAKAEAIAGAVHLEDDGQPHLQMSEIGDGHFLYQIWRADGRVLARFAPGVVGDVPGPAHPDRRFGTGRLGDGTAVRSTVVRFSPQPDEDQFDHGKAKPVQSDEKLTLVVAHDLRAVEVPLAVLSTGMLLTAVVVGAGILATVTWGVRRGLRPLADVTAAADRIGPESLDVRFPTGESLPPELRPIASTLNDLLGRLAEAFDRERRFSAAVAHELRTPLAELRSACDVALAWPDDVAGLSTALVESRDVAVQMTSMVQTLLSISRRQTVVESAPVPIPSVIEAEWKRLSSAAVARQLSTEFDVNPIVARTDPTLLSAVIRNLLENAVAHATAGGRIRVRAGGGSLTISNTAHGLNPADVNHLFEPFWRADQARTAGSGHVGLGLSLVRMYCDLIGVKIVASLDGDELRFDLAFPVEP